MLRNTFFALAAVLGLAASSQAAIMLSATLAPTQPEASSGLSAYILTATATDGETISGIQDPFISANAGGAGLHQVWAPFAPAGSPTRESQVAPLWNDAWLPYDSYWFFTGGANDLAVGGPLTETNSQTGGATGLPDGAAGAPITGFGNLGPDAGKSRGYTLASGLQGPVVDFGQFVMKAGESVLVDIRIGATAGDGSLASQTFTGFIVGGGGDVELPVAANLSFLGIDTVVTPVVNGLVSATGDEPITFGDLTFVSYTPGFGADPSNTSTGGDAALTGNAFSFTTQGNPRGTYLWSYSATNAGGADLGDITVQIVAVPEPSTLALFGLAMVGGLGLVRRRNG